MNARQLEMRECATFTGLRRVAVAFACELSVNGRASEPACGFRLGEIYRRILSRPADANEDADAPFARARRLIEPGRSFLDDVTTGPPGVNGRPLLLSARIGRDDRYSLPATIVRQPQWDYAFENTSVSLSVGAAAPIPVNYHDLFCIFESGRVFYIASFGQEAVATPKLDEYGIIQLERMAIDPALAEGTALAGFRLGSAEPGTPDLSLREFIAERLAALADPIDDAANALHDVLRPFGIVDPDGAPVLPSNDWLRNALVSIEDAEVLQTARFAFLNYSMEERSGSQEAELPKLKRALAAADKAWTAANRRTANQHEPKVHEASNFPGERASGIYRRVLAFAGMAQGVPDFARQDESEVHDSTRPATEALEGMVYVHPAFQLAIGINWRTFADAQEELGACPYVLIAWLVGLHDEVIVTDMERRIELMIYGAAPPDADLRKIGRAEPAADLMRIRRDATRLFRSRHAMLDENLRARLDIYRWCSIHRSGNVFRYPSEHELLAAVRRARATDARFDDAHAMLDRYESLVEDLSSLTASYSATRTNWLLGILALFGVITLPKAIEEAGSLAAIPWVVAGMLVAAGFIAYLIWNRRPHRHWRERLFRANEP